MSNRPRTPSRTRSSEPACDLPTLRDPDRFDAWLHRLLVHACIDEARRLRRHRLDVELTSISVPSIVDDAIGGRGPRPTRARLPPDRTGVAGRDRPPSLPRPSDAGRGVDLCIPLGTAKSRLHRALNEMRAALDADARVRGDLVRAVRHDDERAVRTRPSAWLHEDAAFRVPDHLDVLEVTRRRPATGWSSLERWLPVDTTFHPRLFQHAGARQGAGRRGTDPDPRRRRGLCDRLAAPAAAAVRVGKERRHGHQSRRRPHRLDPATDEVRPLAVGEGYDFSPILARRLEIVFLRSDARPPSTPDSSRC